MDPAFESRQATPVDAGDAPREDRSLHRSLAALQRAPVAFFRVRLQPYLRVEEISHGIELLTGYTADEFATEPDLIRRLVHPDDRRRLDAAMDDPSQLATTSGIRLIHRDGRVVRVDHVAIVTRDDQGAVVLVEGLVRDVTDLRSESITGLGPGEAEDIPVVAYLAESAGFAYLSPSVKERTGFSAEEWVRQPTLWAERLHPDDRARVLFLSTGGAAGHAWQAEYRWLARDGRVIRLRQASAPIRNANGDVVCLQGLLLEGTADSGSFTQINAVAQLAGVVAHDFNNLLTVVLGHSEMLVDTLTESGRARESALEIKNAAEAAARISSQLLALSGRQAFTPRVVDLNEVITDVADTLHQLAGGELEVRFDLASNLPQVEIDVRQMERVLRNLVVDARDAMTPGGRVAIATHAVRQGGRRLALLVVADSRPRISEDALASIFEPVLASRKGPRGAGLNRAAVHGIVTQSGGRISVDQAPAGGLTFTIALPAKS